MNSSAFSVRRVFYLSLVFASAGYIILLAVHHSPWYKNRLYHQLLTGRSEQRLAAATALTRVNGREFLLQGLKSDVPEIRELSRRGLEHLWFTDAGGEAYEMVLKAHEAAEREEFADALEVLNQVVALFPDYAEGWNRRASIYWQTGEYHKSIADSRRVLALNANHYGAWQGIGICYLNLGRIREACDALRATLRIIPHDDATRNSLQECEELLRSFPPAESHSRSELLI